MNRDTFEMIQRVERLGISTHDAWALRRIAMQLHRWHELECGVENGGVERDEETGKPIGIRRTAADVTPPQIARLAR